MAGTTAIKDVGETLVNLFKNKMNLDIVLGSPGEIDEDSKLSLFLFQVLENIHLKNREMQQIDSNKLKYPPLSLDLYYLLTAHFPQETTAKTYDAHKLLGQAMQVLYDNAILTGDDLHGSLKNSIEELHITLNPMGLEDITNIWNTFQNKSYKPSVCYVVSPVNIESARPPEAVSRVISKEIKSVGLVPVVK
jgi:hypothetical protein